MLCFSGCWRFVAGPSIDDGETSQTSDKQAFRQTSETTSTTRAPDESSSSSSNSERPKPSRLTDGVLSLQDSIGSSSSPQASSPRKLLSPLKGRSPRWLKQKALGVVERSAREVGALAERYSPILHAMATQKLRNWPMSPRSYQASPRSLNTRCFFAEGHAGGCIVSGTLVEQPKDGSCLFHSIARGLSDRTCSAELRRGIAAFIAAHPSEKIANTTIEDWVKIIAGKNHRSYAKSLASPDTWGGDLELAVATRIMDININVFEQCQEEPKGHFRCIASFGRPAEAGLGETANAGQPVKPTVNVVYHAKPARHYDALLVDNVRIL